MDGVTWLRGLPDRRPTAALALSILACVLVGASGGLFTAAGLEAWYPTLARPALAPPDWVFAPVWTTLFVLSGVAVWLVWRAAARARTAATRRALAAFALQFAVNVAWSAVFFGLRSIAGGLVVVVTLWVLILVTIRLFARVDRRAAALLVPYLLWVSFAAYLNYGFFLRN
jgi:tryptophan-rich sensory protein